jgi:hypothetical protein
LSAVAGDYANSGTGTAATGASIAGTIQNGLISFIDKLLVVFSKVAKIRPLLNAANAAGAGGTAGDSAGDDDGDCEATGDLGEVSTDELNRGHAIGGKPSSRLVGQLAAQMRATGYAGIPSILAISVQGALYVVDGHHRLAAAILTGTNPTVQTVDPTEWIRPGGYDSIEDITGPTPPNNIRDKGKKLPC